MSNGDQDRATKDRRTGEEARGKQAAPKRRSGRRGSKRRPPRKVKILEARPSGSFVLELDRDVSALDAVDFLFEGGILPDGAKLEPGDGARQWKLEINSSAARKLSKKARAIRRRFKQLASSMTQSLHLHLHERYLTKNNQHPADAWYKNWILGPPVGRSVLTRWDALGITPAHLSNPDTFAQDFKQSLKTPGAVVIYFGHTMFLANVGPIGLIPRNLQPPKNFRNVDAAKRWLVKNHGIPNGKLRSLLKGAKAKIVLLANCQSKGCVKALPKEHKLAIIATDSGKDQVTDFLQWQPAVRKFLDVLSGQVVSEKPYKLVSRKGGAGTVGDALTEANKSFIGTDSFVWVSGDRSARIVP